MIKFEDGKLIKDTLDTIIARLVSEFKSVWGKEINVEQNTYDGQEINIRGQGEFDDQDTLIKMYNATKVNSAEGVDLESICYSGALITRNQGSNAILEITITTDRDSVTLNGIDSSGLTFSASSTTGIVFDLVSTVTIPVAGEILLTFQARELGDYTILPDSVSAIDTPVVGVTAVNNPSKQRIDGTFKETDAELRARYKYSISRTSVGYGDGLIGSLFEIVNVVAVSVFENDTDATDSRGITPNSIFVIIDGGDNEEIGTVILQKKGSGCGMYNKGGVNSVSVNVTLPGTETKEAKFERPTQIPVYIRISIKEGVEKTDEIKTALLSVTYNLGDTASVQDYYTAVSEIDGVILDEIEISVDKTTYSNILEPSDIVNIFISSEVEVV